MPVNQVDSTSLQSTGVNRVDPQNVSAERNQTENVNSQLSAAYQVEFSQEAQEKSIREQEELASQAQEEPEVQETTRTAPQPSGNATYNSSGEIA